MPYQVNAGVSYAGEFHALGTIVSDADAAAILAEHPSALTRITHDDDLCVHMRGGCDHDSHDWNATPSRAFVATASKSDSAAPAAMTGV